MRDDVNSGGSKRSLIEIYSHTQAQTYTILSTMTPFSIYDLLLAVYMDLGEQH